MDFALDAEQDLIVQTVRKFARDLRGWSADADRAGAPPDRLISVASGLGFFVEDLDGYSHLTRALRGFELGRGCAGLAALLETNVEPALAVATWGDADAKAELAESINRGGIATFAHDSRGVLEIDGDRVTGKIGPVPALAAASHVLVATGPNLLLIALSPGDVTPITPSGWRAARWGKITFDRTKAHVIANDGGHVQTVLAWARASLAARAAGVATAAMEYAQQYASERIQFGQPIGSFESIIRLRDDAETGALAARLMALHAAWAIDRRLPHLEDLASRARVVAGDAVTRATIDAVQIYGGYGFVNDFPVEKLMRDARAFEALHGDERLGRVLSQKLEQP